MCSKRKTTVNDRVLDKFLEGDMSIEDYTAAMNVKVSKHGRGHKRGPNTSSLNRTTMPAMKRLSEFFGNSPATPELGKQAEVEETKQAAKVLKSAVPKMSLTDILAELDEPVSDVEESQKDLISARGASILPKTM